MMADWTFRLARDPIKPLIGSGNDAVSFFARRDLLGPGVGPIEGVWGLPEVRLILRKQLPDGSWKYPGRQASPGIKYGLLDTWKQLRYLVDAYCMDRPHPAVSKAAEYVLSCQM